MKDFDYENVTCGNVDLGYLATDLSFMTRVLSAHVRVTYAEYQRKGDTAGGALALMSLIGLNPGISQNDLAMTVVMKKSAVTKAITEMEERGLVVRSKHKSDRRFNALTLSAAGTELWHDLRNRNQDRQEILLHPLTLRDRERLFNLLGRLVTHCADRDERPS